MRGLPESSLPALGIARAQRLDGLRRYRVRVQSAEFTHGRERLFESSHRHQAVREVVVRRCVRWIELDRLSVDFLRLFETAAEHGRRSDRHLDRERERVEAQRPPQGRYGLVVPAYSPEEDAEPVVPSGIARRQLKAPPEPALGLLPVPLGAREEAERDLGLPQIRTERERPLGGRTRLVGNLGQGRCAVVGE